MPTDTLALSIIVKDEPVDRVVMLLDYMRPVCSQMVVLDTGSEGYHIDRQWYELAGATTVEQIGWRHDFSWARNQTLPYIDAEWTIHLDADELPTLAMYEHVKWVLSSAAKEALGVLYFAQNFWGGRKELKSAPSDWHVRMFRTKRAQWYKKVHEQVMLDGKDESQTRDTKLMIRAPQEAYFINSKPAKAIAQSNELYRAIGEAADKRSL